MLGFTEFLRLKGDEELIKRPEMFENAIKKQVPMYMKRQLPELVKAGGPFIHMYLESIINKMVYEDLPRVFPVENEDVLKQILLITASNPGMITDYESLANDLGITRKTLVKYISYLERGFLLQKCYNFSRNRLTDRGYERLDPDVMKVASPVHRGLGAGNGPRLLGNLHVRFCEGAHSNLGAITPTGGALWALLDDIPQRQHPVNPVKIPCFLKWIRQFFKGCRQADFYST